MPFGQLLIQQSTTGFPSVRNLPFGIYFQPSELTASKAAAQKQPTREVAFRGREPLLKDALMDEQSIELTTDVIETIRSASKKLGDFAGRQFQSEVAIKYCGGNARRVEGRGAVRVLPRFSDHRIG